MLKSQGSIQSLMYYRSQINKASSDAGTFKEFLRKNKDNNSLNNMMNKRSETLKVSLFRKY